MVGHVAYRHDLTCVTAPGLWFAYGWPVHQDCSAVRLSRLPGRAKPSLSAAGVRGRPFAIIDKKLLKSFAEADGFSAS